MTGPGVYFSDPPDVRVIAKFASVQIPAEPLFFWLVIISIISFSFQDQNNGKDSVWRLGRVWSKYHNQIMIPAKTWKIYDAIDLIQQWTA